MNQIRAQNKKIFTWIIISALAMIILIIDLCVPLGIAIGVLYIVVILLISYYFNNNSTIFGAIITSTFVLIGFYFSPVSDDFVKILSNRLLSIFSIWTTALLLIRIKKESIRVEVEKEKSQEKEVLLKEIHHRVKNNLQVISSLLTLQSGTLRDQQTKASFTVLQNRINTIASVHELLYLNKNMSKINFKEYLSNLIYKIIESIKGKNNDIQVKLDVGNVYINIDTLVPLGLIVNEIVTNSLKHGFVNNNKGVITVQLIKSKNSQFQLILSDDGIGFDRNFMKSNEKTLGLKLIDQLSRQLKGSAVLDRTNVGTKYKITFQLINQPKHI